MDQVSKATALPKLQYWGADLSFASHIENCKIPLAGNIDYPWELYRDSGFNLARFRIWVDPRNGMNNLEDTLEKAREADDAGLGLYLDFHYSDSWADPNQQTKPSSWQDANFNQLKALVYHHTLLVLNAFAKHRLPIEIVQIGNEISNGMLWEDGRIYHHSQANWERFAGLLQSARLAISNSQLPVSPKVMLHIETGGDYTVSRWFFDNIGKYGIAFDMIGLSYYPWWQGKLPQLQSNLEELALRYNKPILLAEVAYPFTLDYYDYQHNAVGLKEQLHYPYAASPGGQRAFLTRLAEIVHQVPNKLGIGMVYWAPDWLSGKGRACHSYWENLTLFDRHGKPLPAFYLYSDEGMQ